jgi:hypothetical protein
MNGEPFGAPPKNAGWRDAQRLFVTLPVALSLSSNKKTA